MNWRLKICDYHQLLFPQHHSYILFEGDSIYQHLSVKYQPQINFLGMFSNDKFMAGCNTKTKLPWNSPFFLVDFYLKQPKKFLFLGGGPCCAPTALWKRDNDRSISIDIVEQDPLVLELAAKFFNLPKDRRINIHHTQAQQFLIQNKKRYDAIFFDLGFTYERRNDKKYSFCAQKFTLKQLKKALTPQGIIIYVVIARRQCHQKQFLCELYQQFKKFFNYCELYSDEPQNHKKIQSHVFILNQKNMQNNKPFTKLNKTDDRWSNLYQELKGKQMNASVLT